MVIEMCRGDIFSCPIGIYINGQLAHEEMDEVYFTVKTSHYIREPLFQKKASDGSLPSDGNGSYVLTINPEDTNDLDFGAYEFDIEVVKLPTIKRTFTGYLILAPEVTHACNEVNAT